MGPTWGPPGSCRPQMGPMCAAIHTFQVLWELGVNEVGEITAIIQDHIEGFAIREHKRLLDAPDVFFISLTLPGIDGQTLGSQCSGSMVMGGEDVTARPGDLECEKSTMKIRALFQHKGTVFPGMGIPMFRIRRLQDCLIFNMGIPILARQNLDTEMGSRLLAASLISPWLLWWPPAESHYNIYDHCAVGYVNHAHYIVLLCSVGHKITTTIHVTMSSAAIVLT